MKLSPKILFSALSMPIVLSACVTNSDQSDEITPTDLQHHNWQLVSIDGNAIAEEKRGKLPNLEIGEKMTANGNAGCNQFFGQGELKDNQFRIEQMGMTMKLCNEQMMEVEQAFSQTLSQWSDMTLTKDEMVLSNDLHRLTFKLSDWKN
jgi:heat shock protein HslJ